MAIHLKLKPQPLMPLEEIAKMAHSFKAAIQPVEVDNANAGVVDIVKMSEDILLALTILRDQGIGLTNVAYNQSPKELHTVTLEMVCTPPLGLAAFSMALAKMTHPSKFEA